MRESWVVIKFEFCRKVRWIKMLREWSEQERLEIEAEQEMIAQVERENWMEANNISDEY